MNRFDLKFLFHDSFFQNNNLISQNRLSSNIYEFSYSNDHHFGLFHFLTKLISWNDVVRIFYVSGHNSSSSSFELFFWNNTSHSISDINEDYFMFTLLQNWKFLPYGYKIRSSNQNFPKNWVIQGLNDHSPSVVLDVQQNLNDLCSEYAKKSFQISNDQFFKKVKIYPKKKHIFRRVVFYFSN